MAQTNVAGSDGYGKFSIDASGNWTYTANTAHDEFVAGTTYTDTLTVAAADGTTHVLTVNILGTNDAAVIAGVDTRNLTETNAALTTGGTLTVSDVDGRGDLCGADQRRRERRLRQVHDRRCRQLDLHRPTRRTTSSSPGRPIPTR